MAGLQITRAISYLRSVVAVEKMFICNLNASLEKAPGHTPATAEIVPDLVKTKQQQNSIPGIKAGYCKPGGSVCFGRGRLGAGGWQSHLDVKLPWESISISHKVFWRVRGTSVPTNNLFVQRDKNSAVVFHSHLSARKNRGNNLRSKENMMKRWLAALCYREYTLISQRLWPNSPRDKRNTTPTSDKFKDNSGF